MQKYRMVLSFGLYFKITPMTSESFKTLTTFVQCSMQQYQWGKSKHIPFSRNHTRFTQLPLGNGVTASFMFWKTNVYFLTQHARQKICICSFRWLRMRSKSFRYGSSVSMNHTTYFGLRQFLRKQANGLERKREHSLNKIKMSSTKFA